MKPLIPSFPIQPRRPGRILPMAAACALALAGCGKPPSSGGPPGDFPVSAVVAPVERRALEEKAFLVGSLEAIEEVDLVSELDARVQAINFQEGQAVEAGQVLIQFDDRKLGASLAEMRARYNLAKAELERSANLLSRNTISQQEFDRAEAEFDAAIAQLNLAEDQLSDATIRAPFDGVMTERLVSLGQFTTRGQRLASLVAVDPIEVEFNVPERYIGQLAMGQRMEIGVEAFPGETFAGPVTFISPRVDRDSRTVLVKARLANDDQRLKPGMFGSLELVFKVRDEALVIPEAAVSYSGDRASVVVMGADGKAEFRRIETGNRLSGVIEVTDGLDEGERVVVEGFQKMRPGSVIQPVGE
jgi:membrane fusion protein (multidrug efflux system)